MVTGDASKPQPDTVVLSTPSFFAYFHVSGSTRFSRAVLVLGTPLALGPITDPLAQHRPS